MSRTILPIGAEFPDLRFPQDGPWTLTVVLSKIGDCPMMALVDFFQDQTQINNGFVLLASMSVSVTNTPTPYSLTLTQAQVDEIVRGRCHVSELLYSVSPIGGDCSSSSSASSGSSNASGSSSGGFPCCNPADEPASCHVTFTSSCAAINGAVAKVNRIEIGHWAGSTSGSPVGWGVDLRCRDGVWTLGAYDTFCSATMMSSNAKCTPSMSGDFTGGVFQCQHDLTCQGDAVSAVLSP